MDIGENLRLHLPRETGETLGTGRTGLPGLVGRWSPFVFPWSALQRMTGVVVSESGVTLARGRLDGRFFHVEGTARLSEGDLSLDPGSMGIPGSEPVCVCLPRDRTMVRHFRVPATSETEIEAMLPHLMAGELPQSIEHFSWVWSPLPVQEEGFTLVAVYVARNDQLGEFLAPLVGAGLNIVGLVPEGWGWAHAIGQVGSGGDAADETGPRCVVIRGERNHYLVVEYMGRLLFDSTVPASLPLENGVRMGFENLLGFPLPVPKIWPDALPSPEDADREKLFFAASVAAAGLEYPRVMVTGDLKQRSRRRTALGALAGMGRLAALFALIWLAFTVVEDTRARGYLAVLERQLADDGTRVETLQMEYNAIRESNRDRTGNSEILQVMSSLRRHVKAPIFLAHLNYVEGRGVTLRGKAPASSNVLEMTEKREADPLWKGLRVMQLRSEKRAGAKEVHFVVEGQLN